ncbi:YraN family protein [uncultured Senegalimassilia sp.]|uniref:YraN family protein n=1 Tax=uncultured Senegalimassilia sp. TaxID=1714350 RepID=UPI0025D5F08F|nr:YraN family protein [uncultured Senegalimassilia sp.]
MAESRQDEQRDDHRDDRQDEQSPNQTSNDAESAGSQPNLHNKRLGRLGEDVAARYLVSRGYEIIARNWTCQAGEADIIARDDDILVFAEVKTRSSTEKGFPSEAVDSKKRQKYLKIAELFTSRYDVRDLQIRFDVMSLVVTDNAHATIRHYINAFGAESL